MYGRLDATHYTEGHFVQAASSSLRQGKRIDPMLMFNVFGKAASDFFPGLDEYRKALARTGAPGVYLAGSGPCLFTLSPEEGEARQIFLQLKKQGSECYLASSFIHTNVGEDFQTSRSR
jgi:4-diphosphocytidyl-2-C-methyl-D-erythritol kinase